MYAVALEKELLGVINLQWSFDMMYSSIFLVEKEKVLQERGMEYSEDDFCNEYFPTDWHKCYNISKECCYIQSMYTYTCTCKLNYNRKPLY